VETEGMRLLGSPEVRRIILKWLLNMVGGMEWIDLGQNRCKW